jgi:hypothetical protein
VLVVCGEPRLLAAIAARQHPPYGAGPGSVARERYKERRLRPCQRCQAHILRTRFRRDRMPIWWNWNKRPAR